MARGDQYRGAALLHPRKDRVLRDGAVKLVESADLVPGDVVLIEAGDRVPADLRLLAAFDLRADELSLTGKSFAVDKSAHARAGAPTRRSPSARRCCLPAPTC